jgi:outer membrane protein assembly factor BamB
MNKKTFILLFCFLAATTNAQDWQQWRGPNRDGVVIDFQAPARWPAKLNPLWEVKVGAGYSSPVVAGSHIFLHARQGDAETVSALDVQSGKTLWRDSYQAPSGKKKEYAQSEGEGPYSTPLMEAGRLYTLGVNAVLSCYEAQSGKLHWRQDYGRELVTKNRFCGTAMSPLIEGDLLLIYVGDDDKGRLVALDKLSGRERWSWADVGAAYASPIVAEFAGVRQLIVPTDQAVAGILPATGQVLWRTPFPSNRSGCSQNIPMPIAVEDILILSHANGTRAVKPRKSGTQWNLEPVWEQPQFTLGLNSAARDGFDLYGLSAQRKGQYFRLDARTGRVVWASQGREGDLAATLLAGKFLFFLASDGELTIARKGTSQFDQVAKYTVADSKVWAQPVLLRNHFLVRASAKLTLYRFE